MTSKVKELLGKPYPRLLTPDPHGGYFAQIVELPGCFAEGETAVEALGNLEDAAEAWIEAALEQGLAIPEPANHGEASGKFALRLPRSLHARASAFAERDGVSLNQFIVAAIAERIGEAKTTPRLSQARSKAIASSPRSSSSSPTRNRGASSSRSSSAR